jgi:hypothetical protein
MKNGFEYLWKSKMLTPFFGNDIKDISSKQIALMRKKEALI